MLGASPTGSLEVVAGASKIDANELFLDRAALKKMGVSPGSIFGFTYRELNWGNLFDAIGAAPRPAQFTSRQSFSKSSSVKQGI